MNKYSKESLMNVKIFKDDYFLDTYTKGKTLKWYSSDSPAIAITDENFIYEFNSHGYRCSEFNTYDDNYILVFGCSHTEGVGLAYEDIWCNILAKKLNKRCFNYAKQGESLKACFYRTINFLNVHHSMPDLVVYQHPEIFREPQIFKKLNKNYLNTLDVVGGKHLIKNAQIGDYTEFYHKYMIKTAIDMFWKQLDIPIYHFTFGDDGYNVYDEPEDITSIECLDEMARDGMHQGRNAHDLAADVIYQKHMGTYSVTVTDYNLTEEEKMKQKLNSLRRDDGIIYR